jgi:hypothetical protein
MFEEFNSPAGLPVPGRYAAIDRWTLADARASRRWRWLPR